MEEIRADAYACIDAGVDWLTATGDKGFEGWSFWGVGDAILQKQSAAGVGVKPAALGFYRGRRGDGIFVGRRKEDSIIILSGARADEHYREVIAEASNVSRIDVQSTIYCHGEQPHLARDIYSNLKGRPAKRGRPAVYEYKVKHPQGEVLNYGARSSEYFGRFYDKASEAKLGPPRSIWRAELECKGGAALNLANKLARVRDARSAVESVVGAWWLSRGVRLPPAMKGAARIELRTAAKTRGDGLQWLRTQTPRAIRSAIARHGIELVLDALGLSELVEVKHAHRTRHPT